MISHHISLLCRLHAKFQIPTHPFKCHTVALKTVLTDLDWCRLSTLIFFHHILNVAFCYIVLLQLSHCVFSASFVAVENDLAWELRGFLFFLRPLLINNRITVGHLLMARNWNQKCSLCWWLKGVLSLLADPHQLASTVLHPDIQKYKTHCHRMTALRALQFQIDST